MIFFLLLAEVFDFDEGDFERDDFVGDFDIELNRKTIVTFAKIISHIS